MWADQCSCVVWALGGESWQAARRLDKNRSTIIVSESDYNIPSFGPSSVHYQDLLALRPTERELQTAVAWVREQDPTPEFSTIVEQVMTHVRERLG